MVNLEIPYVAIAIVALLAIGGLVFVMKGRKRKPITPLAGIAFAFVLAGIIFGDNRLIGYSLMGIGILLAFADIFVKSKKK
jgi:membrane-bound ClpP family serine protease